MAAEGASLAQTIQKELATERARNVLGVHGFRITGISLTFALEPGGSSRARGDSALVVRAPRRFTVLQTCEVPTRLRDNCSNCTSSILRTTGGPPSQGLP